MDSSDEGFALHTNRKERVKATKERHIVLIRLASMVSFTDHNWYKMAKVLCKQDYAGW